MLNDPIQDRDTTNQIEQAVHNWFEEAEIPTQPHITPTQLNALEEKYNLPISDESFHKSLDQVLLNIWFGTPTTQALTIPNKARTPEDNQIVQVIISVIEQFKIRFDNGHYEMLRESEILQQFLTGMITGLNLIASGEEQMVRNLKHTLSLRTTLY